MKKITLLIMLMCSMSMFATRYLVQNGGAGDATWRTVGAEEVLIDLTVEGMLLNQWFSSLSEFLAGDEIWLINGTYQVSGNYSIPGNFTLYGGFSGTETESGEREQGDEKWEFINETILDANQGSNMFLSGGPRAALFDGITFTNGKSAANIGVIQARPGIVIQNSKFINNSATGQGGAVVLLGGGEVYDSYFYGNQANMGGAINISNAVGESIISGCKFENNKTIEGSNKQGGAIRSQSPDAKIMNSVFVNNEAAGNGSAIYTQRPADKANKIINCLFYDNKTKSALYLNGAAVYNSTVVNNEEGAAYLATQDAQVYNSVFWGSDPAYALVTGIDNAGVEFQNNAFVTLHDNSEFWTMADNIVLDVSEEAENYPHFADPLANDWTITYLSPLLNAADKDIDDTPSEDILGVSRPQGTAYDIGAFELPYFDAAVTMNAGGTVNGESDDFTLSEPKGKPLTYTIVAGADMHIASAKYNGVEVKDELDEGVYNASALNINSTLEVEFGLGTSVDNVNNGKLTYYVVDSSVVLRNVANQEVNIFSISGSRVFSTQSQTSELAIPLTAGVYILKVNDKAQKIIVQ